MTSYYGDVEFVGGLVAIVGFIIGLYEKYGKRYTIIKKEDIVALQNQIASIEVKLKAAQNEMTLQNLDEPLTKTPTYAEVGKAMERLLRISNEFGPDCIFGIDRGGAIVGGILAKHRGRDALVNLLAVWPKKLPPNDVVAHLVDCPPSPKRILVVDDRYYQGAHMRRAIAYLKRTYKPEKIQALVLIESESPASGIGNDDERPGELISVCKGINDGVKLPWDPRS